MAQKEAIMRALMEAMGSSAPMTSKRPMARPSRAGSPLGGAKAPMSAADRMRQRRMDRAGMLQALEAGEMGQMSPIELERLRKKLGMMGGGAVKKYEAGGRVDKILRGLGKGSDMSVAALLRMIEGAGGGMGSGAAMAGRKAAGMNPRGAGTTRSGRQLNKMGVSEDIVGILEGRRPGRKAPLQAMGFESGGAVRSNKKKPKMGCVMKGRGGKYKGQR